MDNKIVSTFNIDYNDAGSINGVTADTAGITIGAENGSSAAPGQIIALKVIVTPRTAAYTVVSSAGTIRRVGTDIPLDVLDVVQFANTAGGQLTNHPAGAVQWGWIGKNPGVTPLFSGRNISLAKQVVGVLQCNYTIFFDRYEVTCDEETQVLCVATITGGDSASCNVTFEKSDVPIEGDDVIVALRVLLCSDGTPAAGVHVKADNEYVGSTNAAGLISLGARKKGDTIALEFWGGTPEIESSLTDSIANDAIVV